MIRMTNKYFYPRAKVVDSIEKLDKATVATKIIDVVEKLGLTKAQAIGPVLNGSDDVQTFNEVWNALEAEKNKMSSVSIIDSKDLTDYKNKLGDGITYLDVDTWYSGILEEKEVGDFDNLKSSFETVGIGGFESGI